MIWLLLSVKCGSGALISDLFNGQLAMDMAGYLKVEHGGNKTSVEGVFSAGDVHDTEWRQVRAGLCPEGVL